MKKLSLVLFILAVARLIASRYPVGMFDEPGLGTYRSDELIFLKTYYLVEKGWNYYPAFSWAIEGDVRRIVLTSDIFQWRLPTLFYLWKVLANNGWQILWLFWVLALSSMAAIFLLMKKLANARVGVVVILLLIPYFADAFQYQSSFLFTEWWGWFPFMVALAALAYDKKLMAYSLFLMAVTIRELFIIPIICFFLIALLQKKNWLGFVTVMLLFGVFIWLHRVTVVHYMQGVEVTQATLWTRLHGFDKKSLMPMVAFMMRRYPLIQYKSNWLLLGLAGLSLRKINSKTEYLFAAGWSLFLVLPFISTSAYNDYWGILFMPTLLITIPLLGLPTLQKMLRRLSSGRW